MKQFNLLFGFKSEKTAEKISRALTALGYVANSTMRPTKSMIRDYIAKQDSLDAVILKEYLDGGDRYGIQELVELADISNVNIVVILSASYRGKNAMKELYAAGILNVYFADGKMGASPDKLAELASRGRTRKEAREYYKIDAKLPDRKLVTYSEFLEYYRYLLDKNEGMNLVDRFVTISRWITPAQFASFMEKLPKGVIQTLMKYEEYYVVQNQLYRAGYASVREKCPKDAIQGITAEKIGDALDKKKSLREERFREESNIDPVPVQTISEMDATDNAALNAPVSPVNVEMNDMVRPNGVMLRKPVSEAVNHGVVLPKKGSSPFTRTQIVQNNPKESSQISLHQQEVQLEAVPVEVVEERSYTSTDDSVMHHSVQKQVSDMQSGENSFEDMDPEQLIEVLGAL